MSTLPPSRERSIHQRLCDDIASTHRRIEYYRREATELARIGDDGGSAIFRQGVVSATEWIEHLNRQKTEIEGLCHAGRNTTA